MIPPGNRTGRVRRGISLVGIAAVLLCIHVGVADAQNCARAWDGSIQCDNGAGAFPTWNGGYRTNGGSTWNQNQLGNGWQSNTGQSVTPTWNGGYRQGNGTTWSQSPLGNSWRSSSGRTCARGLLDNIVCH